ncbi:MAG: winged helix-turn-helix domain-containing protein [Candidatus Aenigmatarchaeota archaeon]
MSKEVKEKILTELEKVFPCDLSIIEIAQRVGISDITASKYVSVLQAEGKIEISRRIGNAILYRLKKDLKK